FTKSPSSNPPSWSALMRIWTCTPKRKSCSAWPTTSSWLARPLTCPNCSFNCASSNWITSNWRQAGPAPKPNVWEDSVNSWEFVVYLGTDSHIYQLYYGNVTADRHRVDGAAANRRRNWALAYVFRPFSNNVGPSRFLRRATKRGVSPIC